VEESQIEVLEKLKPLIHILKHLLNFTLSLVEELNPTLIQLLIKDSTNPDLIDIQSQSRESLEL